MARYYGGKNHIFRGIINLIPEHERYVELFAGSAAVARNLARRNAEALVVELDKEQAGKLRVELPGHRVLNEDGIALLARLGPTWGRETVVFADPPYPIEDRRAARAQYRCELVEAQHQELVQLLHATRAHVLVCGHPWGLYPRAFADWKRHEFPVILRSGKPGVECVWTNFTDPFPLHDYSWWGANKRVRQDLHRQVGRHVSKFERMERHARAAVLRQLVARFGEQLEQAPSPPGPSSTSSADSPPRTSAAPKYESLYSRCTSLASHVNMLLEHGLSSRPRAQHMRRAANLLEEASEQLAIEEGKAPSPPRTSTAVEGGSASRARRRRKAASPTRSSQALPPSLEDALLGRPWDDCEGCGGHHGGPRCATSGKAKSPSAAADPAPTDRGQ